MNIKEDDLMNDLKIPQQQIIETFFWSVTKISTNETINTYFDISTGVPSSIASRFDSKRWSNLYTAIVFKDCGIKVDDIIFWQLKSTSSSRYECLMKVVYVEEFDPHGQFISGVPATNLEWMASIV